MSVTADSLLKSGEISAMIRQGFLSSPLLSPTSSPPPPPPPPPPPTTTTTRRSPPPPPQKPSTTLFDMITQEDLARRGATSSAGAPASAGERRRKLQAKVSAALAGEGNGDVELSVSAGDGSRVAMAVHRNVLVKRSRFFEEKFAGVSGSPVRPVVVEICEVEDVEAYMEVVGMMYSGDLREWIDGEGVDKVLSLLKVSVDIGFDDGISTFLEYLEAIPWTEDEEQKVVSILNKLQLYEPIKAVLERVSVDPSTSANADSIFFRVVAAVLQSKEKKARREMKSLVSSLVIEDRNQSNRYCNKNEISREALYHFCHKCFNSLLLLLSEAADIEERKVDRSALMGEIAREADNLQWLVEILISKNIADEFVTLWAEQTELATCHSKIPCMYRYEISILTAKLCIAIGRGKILVPKDVRFALLETWLGALYEDFGWMRRACRSFDRKMVEDGLSATILTLPMVQQQSILLNWFDCFLNKGDDCPNIQRAFEIWWRRAFVRQYTDSRNTSELPIVVYDKPI